MKKIVIFGATGNTGLCSLEHAVQKGIFKIIILYRFPDLYTNYQRKSRS